MKKVVGVFILSILSIVGFAQNSKEISRADKYFSIKNYDAAKEIYEGLVKNGEKDPLVQYRLGYCLFQSSKLSDRVRSISFLKTGVDNMKKIPQIPVSSYYELASAYHLNNQIEEASSMYLKYKEAVKGDKKEMSKADKGILECKNARLLLSAPRNITIEKFGDKVNTEFTEYNPIVSADESLIAFTALRNGEEKIMVSYNEIGNWSIPIEVDVRTTNNLGTAGITPDGQKMLVFIGSPGGGGNLYSMDRAGKTWGNPVTLGSTINSKYMETTASITPDGKTIYFASNRPGGFGGLDIYKSELNASGEWGKPENLGNTVNSKDDEDGPFIHPDQKTLFFTSDGHNSMGGRDIFKTKLVDGKWTRPENMGYPINTTANDNYFNLTADGRKGFFSSDRPGGEGGQDIYYFSMPEEEANIPLTLLKGRILDADTEKPIPTKIYVIDNQTQKKLDFVYNPDPETGDYLIILPPARNYDMIIECEGFLPYTLNINIPNQDYFYEIYQMIYLKTIKQFDVTVGQEVIVKNAFYDTKVEAVADMRKTSEAALIQSDSIDAYELMADLIAAGDQEGVDYLLELMSMTSTIDQINFDATENENLEAANRTYYYDESDESKFEKKVIDGQTILSLPTFYVTETAKEQKEAKIEAANYDKSLLNTVVKVYYNAGASNLDSKYNSALDKIYNVLKENAQLGVEISGYASNDGDEETNRKLSNERAIAVLEYLNHKGIVRRRIKARGYGATKNEGASKEEGRRVELKIVDLNSYR